jgi:hypothetical protein
MGNFGEEFTAPNAWKGGYYELVLCPVEDSPETQCSVLKRLWTFPSLNGCYLRRDLAPSAQARVAACENGVADRVYGLATLPNRSVVVCGSFTTVSAKQNLKWVGFYLPLGAVANAYPIGAYPFGSMDKVPEWKPVLDSFLADIAKWINEKVPISIAAVGFEIDVSELSPERIKSYGIPQERNEGILWNDGREFQWYPATRP